VATPDATEILKRNRQSAQKAVEEIGAARLRKLLERAQRDLAQRLDDAVKGPGANSFTAAQAQVVLGQIQDVLRALKGGMQGVAVDQAVRASERQTASVLKYLTDAQRLFTGIAEPLPLSDSAVYDHVRQGAESSVLRRIASDPNERGHRGVLDRYGDEVIGHFETELQQRVLQKAPWNEVRDKLVSVSPFLRGAPAHWAERIIRTESMAASNRSSLETIQVAEASLGDVVKILSATIDNRTGSDSFDLHGQIRRTSEPFTDWFGRSYQHPPNRPNDREIVVPHRMRWPIPKALQPKSDAECMARWRQEGRKGPMPSRSKYSTVDVTLFGKGGNVTGPNNGNPPPPPPGGPPAPPAPPSTPPPPPAPPPAPAPTPARPVDVLPETEHFTQPTATIAGLTPSGLPRFEEAGRPIAIDATQTRAIESLLAHLTPKEVLKSMNGGKAPKVDRARPFEGEVQRVFGDLGNAVAQRGSTKKMKVSELEIDQLTFATPAVDAQLAARYAAKMPSSGPVVVKYQDKYYVRDAEHFTAAVALAKAKSPRSAWSAETDVALVNLDREQRPARPTQAWATDLKRAFKKVSEGSATQDDLTVVRRGLRERLLHHGIAGRDDERDPTKLVFTGDENKLLVETTASMPGAAGTHDFHGEVVIRTDYAQGAADTVRVLADRAPQVQAMPMSVQNTLLSRLNVYVHEELHGASAANGSAYQGAGVGMEEAATEILARKVTREMVGHTSATTGALSLPTRKPDGGYRVDAGESGAYFGPYNGYIGALLRETGEVHGHTGVHERVERACLQTRSSAITGRWNRPADQIHAYVDAVGGTPAQRRDLFDRLVRELPRVRS